MTENTNETTTQAETKTGTKTKSAQRRCVVCKAFLGKSDRLICKKESCKVARRRQKVREWNAAHPDKIKEIQKNWIERQKKAKAQAESK